MAGRVFDAQVVLSPLDSPLGKLLSQYVCARITRMDKVDIGLFERDWNNTLYFFMLNEDEQIYMRYGGRDAASPDTYLNLDSLRLALEQGLEQHGRYRQGQLPKVERPQPFSPREIPLLVERTYARHACVECHLIGDFQNIQRERDGTLDRPKDLYRSPDIKTLGIELDVPRGLIVKTSSGAAQAAGVKAGDRIAAFEGTPVWTFGDVQYRYDKVDRRAKEIRLTLDRAEERVDVTVALPARWWWTDLTFRQSTVEPRVYFSSRQLSEPDKTRLGFPPDGFASTVVHVDEFARSVKSHELRAGDVVFGVDGVQRDELANTAELYIKLYKKAGDSVMLDVLREGKRLRTPLRTYRMSFRK
jgi:hypothetical protein